MSNDNFQNTNEKQFTPQYGSDDHGIGYSCGHINPLQNVIKVNFITALQDVQNHIANISDLINTCINEALEFANNRCEDVRSINAELRSAVDCGCPCGSNYDCPQCNDYYDEIQNLENELKKIKESLENANEKLSELDSKLEDVETL